MCYFLERELYYISIREVDDMLVIQLMEKIIACKFDAKTFT